ncbi:MAG: DUF4386 family protein [Fibrobacteres bacterium]|nr:DUF4386 family protein [Fibrobacterota bacterium]
MELQKWGARAAPVLALVYIAGIALNLTVLDTSGIVDGLERTRFQVENQGAMSAFILVLYVLFGCLVPVVALALHERLSDGASQLMKLATGFAFVWSTLLIGSGLVYRTGLVAVAKLLPEDPSAAVQLMRTIEAIHEGLGCTVEIPGGLWILLTGLAIRRTGTFPRACGSVGMVVGVAGLLTIVPIFYVPAVGAFALLSILWFSRMGYLMSRPVPSQAAL